MPESAQFFSVIIQASAGILAIIIALITVLHSIGVEERTPRTQELHSDLVDISEEYRFPFQDVSLALDSVLSNDLYEAMRADYCCCTEVINNSNNYGFEKVLQAHVYRIEYWLSQTRLRNYHTLTEQQLNAISDSAEWLMNRPRLKSDAEELYEQIMDQSPGTHFQFEYIFPSSDRLSQWLQDTNQSFSDETLEAYMILFRSFGRATIPRIMKGRQDTLVDYQSPMGNPRNTIAVFILIVAGILVPLSFLISIPAPIWAPSPWELFAVQFGIIVFSGGAAAYLFRKLWGS